MEEVYLSICCDVFYVADKNVVLVHWKKYCELEQYREPLMKALQVINAHRGKWVTEYFMPKAKEYGCSIIYFIIDKDNSLKEELEGQEKDASSILEFRYIYGIDEVER